MVAWWIALCNGVRSVCVPGCSLCVWDQRSQRPGPNSKHLRPTSDMRRFKAVNKPGFPQVAVRRGGGARGGKSIHSITGDIYSRGPRPGTAAQGAKTRDMVRSLDGRRAVISPLSPKVHVQMSTISDPLVLSSAL